LRAKLLCEGRPEEVKNLIIAKMTNDIFVELKNTLADIWTAHFKGQTEDL